MPQKVINFKGINRSINEYNANGECEDVINLRPIPSGGCRVVKPKYPIYGNISFDAFYVHAFGEVDNRIVTANGSVMLIDQKNNYSVITEEFYGKDVELSFAGNVMVILCKADNKQLVFKFEDGQYKKYHAGAWLIEHAEINFGIDYDEADREFINNSTASASAEDHSVAGFNKALNDATSAFYRKYPNGLCGAAVVGCTYELEDGNEVWSTAFIVANSTIQLACTAPHLNTDENTVTVNGATSATLELTFSDQKEIGIRKVNIYASLPVTPYEVVRTKKQVGANVVVDSFKIEELSLSELHLDDKAMFYQGSVVPQQGKVTFALKFDSAQAGENIMNVTPGLIERVGDVISYNNRFHYYNSENYHIIQPPTVSNISDNRVVTNAKFWAAYVKFGDKWKLINNTNYQFSELGKIDVIYPMAGIKEIAFVHATVSSSSVFSVLYDTMFTVELKDSSAYNYSYAFDVTPSVVDVSNEFYNKLVEDGQVWSDNFMYDSKVLQKKELNALNVTAQYNPFVFTVENSYSFSGDIIDIATSYLPISSVQIGQYPLTVFTTNGIFALEQGNGSVLYSNVIPLQPLISRGKSLSTPHGTFFFSSNDLYLLSGREAANVSMIMHGKLEQNIKDTPAYKKLFLSDEGAVFNFNKLISSVEFKEFIKDASLTYDPLQDEVIISSNKDTLLYSYVLNLVSKAYHKIPYRYSQFQNGGRYVITNKDNNAKSILDLFTECDGQSHIFLQSRPMSLDLLYSHIQRLMLFIDTKLIGSQCFFVSVFASDNLHDWKCIISAQKQDTVLRHIRTNRAAKSYKDYVIIISGLVSTDTDLSDLIADYTVVSRRLG